VGVGGAKDGLSYVDSRTSLNIFWSASVHITSSLTFRPKLKSHLFWQSHPDIILEVSY